MKSTQFISLVTAVAFSGALFAQGAAAPKTVIPIEKDYYLTPGLYTGAEASSACEEGYHFANMWEAAGLANMSYNTELGYTGPPGADLGYGPLAEDQAWVRSGHIGPSTYWNCDGWASEVYEHTGMIVLLSLDDWYTLGSDPIRPARQNCSFVRHVFCVSDPVLD